MDEERLRRRIYNFQKGDHVALASRAAISKVHFSTAERPNSDPSLCFELVGRVECVMPTGDVDVTFSTTIRCTIEPEALVKVPKLVPGALVKLVDDIRGEGNLKLANEDGYNAEADVCGGVCIVLQDSAADPNRVSVTLGKGLGCFSRIHLDFVAHPVYEDFRAGFTKAASHGTIPGLLSALEILKVSMQQVMEVDMWSSSTLSPCAPGDKVVVTEDIIDFIPWLMHHYSIKRPGFFRTIWQWFKNSHPRDILRTNSENVMRDMKCLQDVGNVLQANTEGDAIVHFRGGIMWRIPYRFLDVVENSNPLFQDAGTPLPDILSEIVDASIRCSLSLQNAMTLPQLRKGCLHSACFSGNKNLFQHIAADHMSLESEDESGNKPIHYAAHGNQPEMIDFLLRSGATINATNNLHHTALHFATKEGFVNCVRELKKHHRVLNANIQDDSGNTALHVAVAHALPRIVEELLSLPKVDLSLMNQYGLNCLHMAAVKGNDPAVDMILWKNCELAYVQEEGGYAAIHFAVFAGHYHIVETLLTKSGVVDLPTKHDETPLLIASRKGYWKIVELLLLAGADVNKGDQHGNTTLHMSLKKVNEQPVSPKDMPTGCAMKRVEKKLRDHGHTRVDNRLQLACWLVHSGGNIHSSNVAGITPLNIACNLQEPAVEVLGLFPPHSGDSGRGSCKKCLEAHDHASTSPKDSCVFCDDCGRRMASCRSCRRFIVEKVSTVPASLPVEEIWPQNEPVIKAKTLKKGPKIYAMTRNPRGMCIILNNANFNRPEDYREGSELDVDRMKALFTQLLFTVIVRTDLSAAETRRLFIDVSKAESQKDAQCLVVILMSHGEEGAIHDIENEKVPLDSHVFDPFNNENCPHLQGKPKIFFVQACRGNQWDCGTKDVRETSDTPLSPRRRTSSTSRQTCKRIPLVSDRYIAYATIPGYVALKNNHVGSWFLAAVSDVFSKYAYSMSLDGLMREVQKKVMERSTHDGSMQTPRLHMDGWTKELYFNPGRYV
ncbi:uncharacterized protein LOC144147094 isoform X2 [Haemaphysalis longicornis]